MGLADDIKLMQNEGRSEQEISSALQSRGYAPQEIGNALAQAKIKEAVAGGANVAPDASANTQTGGAMQPSMLGNSVSDEPQSPELESVGTPQYPPSAQQYAQPYTTAPVSPQQGYGYSDQYYASQSADAISEIAEQIVAERVEKIRQELVRTAESRHLMETKLEYLDERLKKIERVIDRLQLSILQKVGEYMTNVEDLKTEVVETQKSFKSLLASTRTTTSGHAKNKDNE
jgi:hypothetical protein